MTIMICGSYNDSRANDHWALYDNPCPLDVVGRKPSTDALSCDVAPTRLTPQNIDARPFRQGPDASVTGSWSGA